MRAIARRLGPAAPLRDLTPRWTSLLGGTLSAWPTAPFILTREAARQAHEGTSLVAVVHHPEHGPALLFADRPAAIRLAARCLGADDDAAERAAAANVFTPAHEGALAALTARALARMTAPGACPTVRAITDRVGDALEAGFAGDLVASAWWVTAAPNGFWLTLCVPATTLLRPPSPAARSRPEALGDIAIAYTLVVARERMSVRAVGAIERGDAFVLDGLRWQNDHLAGDATLRFGALDVACTLDGSTTLTIAAPARAEESRMTHDDPPADATAIRTEALASLAVEVTIEVSRGTLSLAEVSALRVGEIVTLGTAIGERVTLRAGGRAIAHGELVDVEGEVGVRVTELL